MEKLLLIDAYAIIYRAYYALIRSPRITSKGRNTSAIFGFCNSLDEVLRKENPQYLAVCFDPPGGHTFRNEVYPEYKATREKQPEDITFAIPYIKSILQARNIPIVEVEGYEADDVIGTLATMASKQGLLTYMMTPDKDCGQLVTDTIRQYRPSLGGKGFEIRGPQEVCDKYGLKSPRQVIDLLALMGDASDNVPGCPGVGEKTAVKLIGQYGSVENIIAAAESIPGVLGRNIRENARKIEFSKFLVTIDTAVPLSVTPGDFKRREPDYAALADIYRELEFRTLLAKLPSQFQFAPAPPAPTPKPAPKAQDAPSLFDFIDDESVAPLPLEAVKPEPEVIVTSDIDRIAQFVDKVLKAERCAVLPHADGADAMTATLHGIVLSTDPANALYVEMPAFGGGKDVLDALQPVFASGVTIVGCDIKRLMVLLANRGINFTAPIFDVSLAHYVLSPETSHDLPSIASTELGIRLAGLTASPAKRRTPVYADPASASTLLATDAAVCLMLVDTLTRQLKDVGLLDLTRTLEFPLVAVLANMERQGMRIDTAELAEMSRHMSAHLQDLEQQVYALAGRKFNIGSPAQVGEVLFGELKIDDKARKTKSGTWSTTEEILEKYAPDHEIVRLILEFRGIKKLLSTYIDALPKLINPLTGKVHTTFNQAATATGRLSSTNPNLQNIPIRTDEGREIRRAFVADPGCLLLSADYSQIELRLMADLSGDPELIAAFGEGQDVHRSTAAKIYNVPIDEVTDSQRRAAKTANFGIIYGISAFGLAERLGIPRGEAKDLIEGYFKSYPGVKTYIDRTIDEARQRGYVATRMGRRRYLPDINSRNATMRGWAERNAVNAPLQGTAADIIKLAMIRIHREIAARGLRSRMIMQVHDELIFNVVPEEAAELQQIVVSLMQDAYSGQVKLTVGAGLAPNWLEAH